LVAASASVWLISSHGFPLGHSLGIGKIDNLLTKKILRGITPILEKVTRVRQLAAPKVTPQLEFELGLLLGSDLGLENFPRF
jgi:hypothetical protein